MCVSNVATDHLSNKEKDENSINYLYKAQRLTDGEEIIGLLLHVPGSPFVYIATVEAMGSMVVDELDNGKTTNLELTRVMLKSVEKL